MKNTNKRGFWHSYKQNFKIKACSQCQKEFKPEAPAHKYCSDECARRAYIERYVHNNYKIDLEQYDELWSDPHCRICGSEGFVISQNGQAKLAIDHDHDTGAIRGLLCHNCNRALGLLKDDVSVLKSAILYLEGATTNRTPKRVEARSSEVLPSDDDIV